MAIERKTGILYAVGVGPGDPELITMKTHRILSSVPVIFAPRPHAEKNSYARSIIEGLVNESEQETIDLTFPMIKDSSKLREFWERATQEIWQKLAEGKDCAFVTEGDPLLYGTFAYVLSIMQERHPEVAIEIVPGVSSINAAAASALLPLSSGGERIAIIPATYETGALRETLASFDTIILMKVHSVLDSVIDVIEEMGLIANCVLVKRCTTEEEEIVRDISKLRGQKGDYFSLLIVRR
ncbi:MAG: precorrin-2 C(20)-methyltransferase [Chloroflexota bacterium]|nr:precorrin-2 C(20)-methyltransferase [Chloroflexota bacterium]